MDAFLGLIFLPKSSDRVRYISLPSLHSPTNTLRSASIAEKRSSSSEAGKRQKMGEWEREEESSLQSTLKKGGEEDIFLHGPHPTLFAQKVPKTFSVPSFFPTFAFALTCSLLMQRRQEEPGVGFFLLFSQVSLQIRAISILCVDRHPWSFSSSPADPAEREKEKVLFSLLLTAGIGFSPPPEPSAENALPLTDRKLDRINSELVFVT